MVDGSFERQYSGERRQARNKKRRTGNNVPVRRRLLKIRRPSRRITFSMVVETAVIDWLAWTQRLSIRLSPVTAYMS
jgi:hypothetical protein